MLVRMTGSRPKLLGRELRRRLSSIGASSSPALRRRINCPCRNEIGVDDDRAIGAQAVLAGLSSVEGVRFGRQGEGVAAAALDGNERVHSRHYASELDAVLGKVVSTQVGDADEELLPDHVGQVDHGHASRMPALGRRCQTGSWFNVGARVDG